MLLKSLNYWSAPGGLDGSLDIESFLILAKQHRFPAVELAVSGSGGLSLDTTESQCREILAAAERIGVQVAGVASGRYWSRSLGDHDPRSRDLARADLERMIRITSWLGCKTLLVIPGSVDVFFQPEREPRPYQEVWGNASAGLRDVLPLAESHNVRLGIENVWNKFLLSPYEMASFIGQFDSEFIGAYVDVANLLRVGYPEDWIRQLGKRVVGIHFKDYRVAVGTIDGFVDLLEGDVNWPEVMAAIREIGYSGPIAAELIPLYRHFPEVRIANASNAMDAILGLG